MPAALTIQTPTRTIARDGKGVTSELKPGVSFEVGDVVSFSIGNTGGLIVHAQDAKKNTWAIYRGGQNWTVSAEDTRIKSLVVEHRPVAGQQKAESLWVPVNVWARQADAEPPAKPDSTPTLSGKMELSICSLTGIAWSKIKPLAAPLKLNSTRIWLNTNDFDAPARPNTARVLEYEAAGINGLWCMAQGGATPAMAKNAVPWTLAALDLLVSGYDANPATAGKTIRIEWGNEPDLEKQNVGEYWRGTINEWANVFSDVCKATKDKYGTRVQVTAAGFSWDISKLISVFPMIANAGADAIGFHGYPRDMSAGALKPYKTFADLAHSRGLLAHVTEGSPGYGTAVKAGKRTMAEWVRDWPTYLIALEAAGVDECWAFNAQDINTTNSAGALFDKNWNPTASYVAVLSAVKA
jgi:hypothetical protein